MELIKTISHNKLTKSLLIVILGSILLTISAKIKIPFYPVPMTMQTFVVLFLGISFGWKIGVATISLYLFEGLIGLPVFAGTPEKGIGLAYFTGPTMGYLIGFLPAVFLVGYLNFRSNIFLIFIKLILAVSTIYILGMFWLGNFLCVENPIMWFSSGNYIFYFCWDIKILQFGAYPFLLAELFKILLLTLLVKKILKFRNFI